MKRTYLLGLVILAFLLISPVYAQAPQCPARLCSNCGFGSRNEYCVKCGKWCPRDYSIARLCGNCGFGNKYEYCVKCGKWAPNNYKQARLCGNCSFGNRKNCCVKCGKQTK